MSATFRSLIFATLVGTSHAETQFLPPEGDALIGTRRQVETHPDDTLVDIAYHAGVGYNELRLANPTVDPWLPGNDTRVLIPSSYLLPDAPRQGVVINLAEYRLYYFPPSTHFDPLLQSVLTYPISIGREGAETPLGDTTIVRKDENPSWYPPASIREEKEAEGNPIPSIVPPGPDNPLGQHALRLGFESYLIHGTNKPLGIGMQVSHGCIRMSPDDIATLFPMIPVGTPVRIIDQPYKIGWHMGTLYVEIHPLSQRSNGPTQAWEELVMKVRDLISIEQEQHRVAEVDWDRIRREVEKPTGVPTAVGYQETGVSRPADYPPPAHPPASLPSWAGE